MTHRILLLPQSFLRERSSPGSQCVGRNLPCSRTEVGERNSVRRHICNMTLLQMNETRL